MGQKNQIRIGPLKGLFLSHGISQRISRTLFKFHIPSIFHQKDPLTFHHNRFPEPGESVACFSSASILFTCVIRVHLHCYPWSSRSEYTIPNTYDSILTIPNTKVWILIQAHPDQKKIAADFASADPAGKHKQTFRSRLRIRSVWQINSEQRPCSHNSGLWTIDKCKQGELR